MAELFYSKNSRGCSERSADSKFEQLVASQQNLILLVSNEVMIRETSKMFFANGSADRRRNDLGQ